MLQFRNVELFYEYSSYLEKGGTGSKKKVKGGATFVPNIYGDKIKLKGHADNMLHLNYDTYGGDREQFYSFGRFKAGRSIDVVPLADQMQMIQHVKGDARHLSDEEKRCRRKGWMGCIMDKETSGDYYDDELPKITIRFSHLWEDEIDLLDVLSGNVSSPMIRKLSENRLSLPFGVQTKFRAPTLQEFTICHNQARERHNNATKGTEGVEDKVSR